MSIGYRTGKVKDLSNGLGWPDFHVKDFSVNDAIKVGERCLG